MIVYIIIYHCIYACLYTVIFNYSLRVVGLMKIWQAKEGEL